MGHNLTDIMGSIVTDRADIGVPKKLKLDEREACDMYDIDKLGKAATGKLVHSKNKRVANPFPSGVDLMNMPTKVASHFSYGTCINNIHKICEMIDSTTIEKMST